MTVILLVFFALCLLQARTADRGTLYTDYLSKENTTPIAGIFVFLVFFRHFYDYVAPNGAYDGFADRFNGAMGQFLVTMFLFYSGFGVMHAISAKGNGYTAKLPLKCLKILIAFNMAMVPHLILQTCFKVTFPLKRILLSTIGWDTVGNNNWYIFTILCLYLLTWLVFTVCKHRRVLALLLLTAGSVLLLLVLKLFRPTYFYNTILCYPFGMWFHTIRSRARECRLQKPSKLQADGTTILWLGALTVLFVLFALSGSALGARSWNDEWMYTARNCLFIALVLLLSQKIRLNNAFLRFLGEHVFGIFVVQRIPLILLNRLGVLRAHPYLGFAAAFLATLLLAVAFDRVTAAFLRVLFRRAQTDERKPAEAAPCEQPSAKKELIVLSALACCVVAALFFCFRFAETGRTVTLTALDEKSEPAKDTQIYLKDIRYNLQTREVPAPTEGEWTWYNDRYCWFRPDDNRATEGMTNRIVLRLLPKQNTSLRFFGNPWKGQVLIETDGWETTFDTYAADETGETLSVDLPGLTFSAIAKSALVPGGACIVLFAALYALAMLPVRRRTSR